MPKFHHCRICAHPWAASKRPIMSRAKACNFIKKRLLRSCFPVNISKFLRTPILNNICERLLLNRIWKRSWKYACEWPKKDLVAQDLNFWKLSSTFYEVSVLYNTTISWTCSKFAKYFWFSHVFGTLLFKKISSVKSNHTKDKVILLNNILINLYSNETQIYFCLACINYCNDVTQITWLCGMEFFINLILQMLGWSCYVLSLVQIEQMVRKLRSIMLLF